MSLAEIPGWPLRLLGSPDRRNLSLSAPVTLPSSKRTHSASDGSNEIRETAAADQPRGFRHFSARAGTEALRRKILQAVPARIGRDRKSTRLNSSHSQISYAVF